MPGTPWKIDRLPQNTSEPPDIGVEQGVVGLTAGVQYRAGVGRHPRVGDDRVDTAELIDQGFVARDHLLPGGDVHRAGRGAHTQAPEFGYPRGVLFFRAPPDDDVAALFGDAPGKAQAQAAVTAGHQCNLAGEIEQTPGHVFSLLWARVIPCRAT
jgi:hypothetical protein